MRQFIRRSNSERDGNATVTGRSSRRGEGHTGVDDVVLWVLWVLWVSKAMLSLCDRGCWALGVTTLTM